MRDNLIDRPGGVRDGEEIDAAQLLAYLQDKIPDLGSAPLEVEQFPAGFSNLTYLLRSGANEFVLRRPPFGAQVKSAHDMAREYRILTCLQHVFPKVPRPVFFCDDDSVMGAPFYVMERVRGVILRSRPGANPDFSPAVMQRLSSTFIETLAEIHSLDYEAAGLNGLGQPAGYVRRQVEGWTKRYQQARTDEVPSIERIAAWLSVNAPEDTARPALIHNDYKYDNLMLAPKDLTRVVAVLDWEMATVGDPLMDVGTSLGYWVDPDDPDEWQQHGFKLTALPGSLRRRELVGQYAKLTGREVGDAVFYYVYGLLKIAVIVQQIHFRFRRGLTRDARFADLVQLVRACGLMATRAIEKGRIDCLN